MADALGTGGSPSPVSAADHRLAQAGLFAPQTSSLDVRKGVLWGPGSTSVITGTSATGTMTVNVAAHHWLTSRATGDGVYLGTKETSTTVNIAAAPGSNSRIDLVYSKQNDATSTVSADGSTGELYGVMTGTAAASPVAPTLPVGAVEVGRLTVAAGATNTLGAGVTISNTAPQTVSRGAPVPVSTTAMRDALTKFTGLAVVRLDDGGRVERWNGSRWAPYSKTDTTLGDAYLAAPAVAAGYPSYTDIATVTATSNGGTCVARFTSTAYNGNSGADRTFDWRVQCDGVTIGPSFVGVSLPLADMPRVTRAAAFSSTPAAGSHTWKLQGTASVASAVFIDTGLLTVVELGS